MSDNKFVLDYNDKIFDLLDVVKLHVPFMAGGYSRDTGGADFDFIIECLKQAKITEITPVLQDWVGTITRRQQGVLILALRGPDGVEKEHPSKNAVRTMRGCVMNSGRSGKPMVFGERYPDDRFMRMDLMDTGIVWDTNVMDPFFSRIDSYNIHFYMHFIHSAAVLGFHHPLPMVRLCWNEFYLRGCKEIHVLPETKEMFTERLKDGLRSGEFE